MRGTPSLTRFLLLGRLAACVLLAKEQVEKEATFFETTDCLFGVRDVRSDCSITTRLSSAARSRNDVLFVRIDRLLLTR